MLTDLVHATYDDDDEGVTVGRSVGVSVGPEGRSRVGPGLARHPKLQQHMPFQV